MAKKLAGVFKADSINVDFVSSVFDYMLSFVTDSMLTVCGLQWVSARFPDIQTMYPLLMLGVALFARVRDTSSSVSRWSWQTLGNRQTDQTPQNRLAHSKRLPPSTLSCSLPANRYQLCLSWVLSCCSDVRLAMGMWDLVEAASRCDSPENLLKNDGSGDGSG